MTATSDELKSVDDSLKVNEIVAVSPAFTDDLLLVIAIVGTTVSTVIVTVLFASVPSVLKFPAASLNVLLATDTTPLAVLLVVGVKVAE